MALKHGAGDSHQWMEDERDLGWKWVGLVGGWRSRQRIEEERYELWVGRAGGGDGGFANG